MFSLNREPRAQKKKKKIYIYIYILEVSRPLAFTL